MRFRLTGWALAEAGVAQGSQAALAPAVLDPRQTGHLHRLHPLHPRYSIDFLDKDYTITDLFLPYVTFYHASSCEGEGCKVK